MSNALEARHPSLLLPRLVEGPNLKLHIVGPLVRRPSPQESLACAASVMFEKGLKRPLPRTREATYATPPGHNGAVGTYLGRSRENLRKTAHGGSPLCCCCCRRHRMSAARLGRILGLQVLGLLMCPCKGFAPPLTAGATLRPDGHVVVESSDSGGGVLGVEGSCGTPGTPGRHPGGGVSLGRYHERRRGRRRLAIFVADNVGSTSCRASLLSGGDEGRPLGMLYDGALLNADAAVKDTCATRTDDFSGRGEQQLTAVTATGVVAPAASKVVDEGRSPSGVIEMDDIGPSSTESLASNLTSRWVTVVNGALAQETSVAPLPPQPEQRDRAEAEDSRRSPAMTRKWSGKGWLGLGSSWRRGEGWTGPQVVESPSLASMPGGFAGVAVGASVQRGVEDSVLTTDRLNSQGAREEGPTAVSNVSRPESEYRGDTPWAMPSSSAYSQPERRSWRVWSGPSRGGPVEQGEDIFALARDELTLYLLSKGATHYEVAAASSALFPIEPNMALTLATWRRWKQNLDGLGVTGFSGSDVANMLSLCPQLLALDYEGQVVPAMELLRKKLGMRPTDMRRVIRKAPEVLAPRADGSTAAEAVEVLRALGVQTRHLRLEALRWPQLLAVPPSEFFQLAAFLVSEEVGMKATSIGSLIRQAPWLVLQRIDGQMLPVARFLKRAGVVDLERVVRAYPKIMCASIRRDLAPKVRFLWEDVGVSQEDLPRVLQTFPLLFALPLPRMQDVVDFLADDLSMNSRDIAKIIRAFPSLLGLERERHMIGVVRYLKKLGVQNVGRFVSRLPPVLGYDVTTNLEPKMKFLVEEMGLSVYDVLTFPAFFSYPLDTVIEPRTEFLDIRGRPVTLVGLNIALQQGDSDFARKVAKVQPRIYREFKEAYLTNREAVRSGEIEAESLVSPKERKAIGNLAGQSTSSNVSEVTARATGLPPKRPRKAKPPSQSTNSNRRKNKDQG